MTLRQAADLPSHAWDRLDAILSKFGHAWKKGERGLIRGLIRGLLAEAGDEERPVLLVELVHEDLERRLRIGESARVEQYLTEFPELADSASVVAELASAEYAWRRKAGDAGLEDEFARRFPSLPRMEASSPNFSVELNVIEGPYRGRSFRFDRHELFLVGRAPEAHFRLPNDDAYFSRAHFLVEISPPRCRLIDLQSQNGTYVNGLQVDQADLSDGDHIRAGRTLFRVRLVGAKGSTASPADPKSPETVDQREGMPLPPGYRIIRELGRRDRAATCLAESHSDRSIAIVTTMPLTGQSAWTDIRRFLVETSRLRTLRHPHLTSLRDSGRMGNSLFVASDHVDAPHLQEWHATAAPLSIDLAARLGCEILAVLAFVHERGHCHNALEPSEIFVRKDSGQASLIVGNPGIRHLREACSQGELSMIGQRRKVSPYLAPEQILDFGRSSPEADQYAAASVVYTLIAGTPPLSAAAPPELSFKQLLLEEPKLLARQRPEAPSGMAAAVHRALSRQPRDRFPTVAAFREALLPYTQGLRGA